MKRTTSPLIMMLLHGFATIGAATSSRATTFTLTRNGSTVEVDPDTLAMTANIESTVYRVSDRAEAPQSAIGLHTTETSASWRLGTTGVRVELCWISSKTLDLHFSGERGTSVTWPRRTFGAGERLVLARDSGALIPVDDPIWKAELTSEPWSTVERLSMPVWGVFHDNYCVSWALSSPFRSELQFREQTSAPLTLSCHHEFHPKATSLDYTCRVVLEGPATSPIAPGLHYRQWLDETTSVTTLREKAAMVPAVNRLLGAPHVYLWGGDLLTPQDVIKTQWKSLCVALANDARQPDSLAARLREAMDSAQWKAVTEAATSDQIYPYLKREIAAGLSKGLRSDLLRGAGQRSIVERVTSNSAALLAAYPGTFAAPDTWGGGVSRKTLNALAALGFDRVRVCVDEIEALADKPAVATRANELGWLVGTYDSYHSIHDPATASSEATWPTAQMTPELWQTGGIMNVRGTFLKGFKGVGRKLSPMAARPYYERRIAENLSAVPGMNYYFMDCDAYGEVYDDYNSLHPMSQEQDAAERCRRLHWLAQERGLVVGAEGGNVYALEGVHLLEGIAGPYFGWGDQDMTNRESKYYRGRYFPSEEPEVQFKPVPLKPKYRATNYDPSVRIPLFQAAFHDAVVTTHHWSNDRFKYPEVKAQVGLWEILWMTAPMVNLSAGTLAKRAADLKSHVSVWGPLHKRLGFQKLTDFRYVTKDHLVQEATWEDGTRITANFGTTTATVATGMEIGSMQSVVAAGR